MNNYRKKPVVIQALQFTGDNPIEIIDFAQPDIFGKFNFDTNSIEYYIRTLEGNMRVQLNDYIIKGVKGEFYPCKPDIFEETYEQC